MFNSKKVKVKLENSAYEYMLENINDNLKKKVKIIKKKKGNTIVRMDCKAAEEIITILYDCYKRDLKASNESIKELKNIRRQEK